MQELKNNLFLKKNLLFIVSSLVALAFLLHHKALEGYWRFDDGDHLRFASSYSPWQYFFDPTVLTKQTYAHITPWNPFFYDIGLSLFGFSPTSLYWMQLCVISASAVAIVALLKNWISLFSAWIAAVFFLLGVPTQHAAHSIMLGHYTTGLLWSLLCMIFFQKALNGKFSHLFLALAAFAYANAALCKELYVPLPLILIFWPGLKGWRDRIYWLWPFIALGSLYMFWRKFVLGNMVGGYGKILVGLGFQESFLNFLHMVGSFYGIRNLNAIIFIFFVKTIIFALIFIRFFTKQDWFRFFAVASSLMLPIIIIITNGTLHLIGVRAFFALWVGFSIIAAFFIHGIIEKKISYHFKILGFFVVFIFGILAIKGQYVDWKSLNANAKHWENYYSAYLNTRQNYFIIKEEDPQKISYINTVMTGAWEAKEKINNSSNPPPIIKNLSSSLTAYSVINDAVHAKNENNIEIDYHIINKFNQNNSKEKIKNNSSNSNFSPNFIEIEKNRLKISWNFSENIKNIYVFSKKIENKRIELHQIPNKGEYKGELISSKNQTSIAKIQFFADTGLQILVSDEISLDFDGKKEILFFAP